MSIVDPQAISFQCRHQCRPNGTIGYVVSEICEEVRDVEFVWVSTLYWSHSERSENGVVAPLLLAVIVWSSPVTVWHCCKWNNTIIIRPHWNLLLPEIWVFGRNIRWWLLVDCEKSLFVWNVDVELSELGTRNSRHFSWRLWWNVKIRSVTRGHGSGHDKSTDRGHSVSHTRYFLRRKIFPDLTTLKKTKKNTLKNTLHRLPSSKFRGLKHTGYGYGG